jgi:alkylation response protein AidB-like acyl-CoA dehydrogenase
MHFELPDDLRALQGRIREFVRSELKPHDAAIEATGEVPESAMVGLRRMGLFGTRDLPTERIRRETRVVRILDGTSEIMRQIIARNAFRNHQRRNASI